MLTKCFFSFDIIRKYILNPIGKIVVSQKRLHLSSGSAEQRIHYEWPNITNDNIRENALKGKNVKHE